MGNPRNRSLGILFLAGVALWGCGAASRAGDDQQKKAAQPVLVQVIGRADFNQILRYVGDLKAHAEVKIFSPVPDRILYFPWKNGQEIQAGQRVALIRKEGLDKGLEQIIAQMEAQDVQLQNQQAELERSRGLLAAGVITRQVFEKIEASTLATLAQKKALEASKGQLAVTVGNANITAPLGGIVAEKMLEAGDMAVPQVPLCRILAVDKLKLWIKLVESDVPKVHLGDKVELRVDAYPERKFQGTVGSIFPYLEQATRTNTVEIQVENPRPEGGASSGQRLLKPGMFARAELVVEQKSQMIAAPEPALLLDDLLLKQQKAGETLRKAFVVKGQKAELRTVRLGARNGALFEVLAGLSPDEQIVIRGQHGLKDGQPVDVVGQQ